MVDDTGIEPVTSPTSRVRSTKWANRPNMMVVAGNENNYVYVSQERLRKHYQYS